jgi:glycosyltransferase involved in cell wall biosynthesis
MNILFATISSFDPLAGGNIYTDLMEELRDRGHRVYVMTASERRLGTETELVEEMGINILRVRTWNIKKTKNLVEKGVGTLLLQRQFKTAFDSVLDNVRFDLVLYSTPPITLDGLVRHIKKRDGAKSYLLLKDIFPQNAVDIGMMKRNGFAHRYFSAREKRLYAMSDFIGCMSPANKRYLEQHHPTLRGEKIEVCPNSIRPRELDDDPEAACSIRTRYGIPSGAVVFSYGGNIGKPQGIFFLESVLREHAGRPGLHFLIVGSGTEYERLRIFCNALNAKNVTLYPFLPKKDYNDLLKACDAGLIFLDPRFTIPNFPSRLLDYLDLGKPVLAATDRSTDIGNVVVEGGFGFWCESGDNTSFNRYLETLVQNQDLRRQMGARARQYLLDHYTASGSADIILRHFA